MASDNPIEDELSYETRLVVLNFLSLLPTELLSHSSSTSGSLKSSGSSQQRPSIDKLSPDNVLSAVDFTQDQVGSDTWQHSLPLLPETSLVERVMNHDKPSEREELMFTSKREHRRPLYGAGIKQEMGIGEDEVDNGQPIPSLVAQIGCDSVPQKNKSEEVNSSSTHSFYAQGGRVTGVPQPAERQVSNVSTSSEMTDGSDQSSLLTSIRSTSSHRSNYIDLQSTDVDSLVQRGLLPQQLLPLANELNQEMDKIREMKDKRSTKLRLNLAQSGFSGSHTAVLTPESEVAEQLRHIGDFVQKEYGPVIERAVNSATEVPNDQFSYEFLENIATQLIQNFPDIPQRVAVVMLLSQRLAMYGKDVHKLVDFTVKFVMSKMADYILRHGGWSSIVALDNPGSPVSPSNISTEFPVLDQQCSHPGGDIMPSSSSNTTVTPMPNSDTDQGFVTDSGFTSVASTDRLVSGTVNEGLSRDATLDSIASFSHDNTPAEVITVLNPVSGTCKNTEDKLAPSEKMLNSMDETDCGAAAVRQGQLLRQVSEKLSHEVTKEHQEGKAYHTFALVTLGSILILVTAAVIYRKIGER